MFEFACYFIAGAIVQPNSVEGGIFQMMTGISVISLIAYDWELLLASIPVYYEHVDEIVLGLDWQTKSWTGLHFSLPSDFEQRVSAIDREKKIRIVRSSFYDPSLSPIENETLERNYLSNQCKTGNWLVSIDADEFLTNPSELFDYLNNNAPSDKCIFALWATVFKTVSHKNFVVSANKNNKLEAFPIATKTPASFRRGRYTDQLAYQTEFLVLHHSWNRSRAQIEEKLQSWGHADHINVSAFVDLWISVSEENFRCIRNFHPIMPETWYTLKCFSEADLRRLTRKMLLPNDGFLGAAYRSLRRLTGRD